MVHHLRQDARSACLPQPHAALTAHQLLYAVSGMLSSTAAAIPLIDLQATSYRRSLDVHEFEGDFQGTPVLFRMTSVIGHVFSLDFLPQFQSWEKDPKELFFAGTRKSESNPKVGPFALDDHGTAHHTRTHMWVCLCVLQAAD